MAPGTGQIQNQFLLTDFIDQQPVWRNVAFPVSSMIPGQRMIMVFLRKGLFIYQNGYDSFKKIRIIPASDDAFVIFFEIGFIFI